MDAGTRSKLAALPPLGGVAIPSLTCKICGGQAPAFDVVDFNKRCSLDKPYLFGLSGVPVTYHRCGDCGFLFTAFFDDWSERDFADFIYNDDYIKVDGEYAERRPRAGAEVVAGLIGDRRDLAILDYGGGAGILARTLGEGGYDAESYDPFAHPHRPDRRFDIVTCFEVIEHSADPIATMRDMAGMLAEGGCVLLGTGLQPSDILQSRGGWWYVGPRNGHVSIHSGQSLRLLGTAAGLDLVHGAGLSAFLPADASAAARAIVAQLGTPRFTLTLQAPSPTSQPTTPRPDVQCWHGIEGTMPRFRWSSEPAIAWTWQPPITGAATIELSVSVSMEIEPGFAARTRIAVNGVTHPLTQRGDTLLATVPLDLDGPVRIVLLTPRPLRPADLSGTADTRALGLAIVAAA